MKYSYHRITPGGKSAEIIAGFLAKHAKQVEARQEFVERFGACGYYGGEYGLNALIFKDAKEAPEGWRVLGSENEYLYMAPRRNSKERKALSDEMGRLVQVAERGLMGAFGLNVLGWFTGMAFYYLTFERIGDADIIGVPDIGEVEAFIPPDSTPLKDWERLKMRDELAEAKAAMKGGES